MKRKGGSVQHGMQGVFVFVLLGLFAVMSTLMVLLGAQMYRNTVERADANNEGRVLAAYVRSMVRAEDAARALSVEEQDGVRALAMREDFDGESYATWVYCRDGWLCEWFGEGELRAENGTPICEAGSFEPELENGLLTVNMTDEAGEPCTVRVALRCEQ